MPSSHPPSSPSRFLGVRLTVDEERRLEEFRSERAIENRSEAVRKLIAEARSTPAPEAFELPPTVLRDLEHLVEEGYFSTVQAALEHALETGLADLVRTHVEGLAALRRHARENRTEKNDRRRADREGRELLRR